MTGWFTDNSLSIGHTPLVRLNRVTDGAPATVLAKIMGRNPAYSVKCKPIVVILPDSGERYLSTVLFAGVFDEKGLAA
jgi:cysteine synthase A